MSVFRVAKTKDYTVMANHHLNDKTLSLKSKGLLSLMLSLPDDWDYTIDGLCSLCVENESAIKSSLKELGEHGYLRIDKIMPDKSATGRIEYAYNIFEQPLEFQAVEFQAVEKQGVEKQGVEKQGVEKQGVENQPLEFQAVEFQAVENPGQLNTKELNTKEPSTKSIPPVTTNVVTSPTGGGRTRKDNPKDNLNYTSKDNPKEIYNIYNNTTYASLSKGGAGGNLSLNRAEAEDDTPSPAAPAPASPAPAPKKLAPVDERFDQFWCVYPRKIGKGAARKAFAKIKPSDELLKRMIVAVVAQSKSDMWTRDRGQYIPNPATWLNQERWEDEVQKPPDPPKPTHGYAERQISEDEFGDDFFVDVMARKPRDGGGK